MQEFVNLPHTPTTPCRLKSLISPRAQSRSDQGLHDRCVRLPIPSAIRWRAIMLHTTKILCHVELFLSDLVFHIIILNKYDFLSILRAQSMNCLKNIKSFYLIACVIDDEFGVHKFRGLLYFAQNVFFTCYLSCLCHVILQY